jgi:flagellar biosynthesis/type III secretory pathway protein FliH
MSMLNEVDCSPDTPVIDAAAERMALKEMEHEQFHDTNEMSGFQRGYSRGFLEGAEFIRSFYRKREMRDHLIHLERERKKREDERKKDVVDDRLLQPVDDALKKVEQESFGAGLHPANYSYDPEDPTPPMGGFHD